MRSEDTAAAHLYGEASTSIFEAMYAAIRLTSIRLCYNCGIAAMWAGPHCAHCGVKLITTAEDEQKHTKVHMDAAKVPANPFAGKIDDDKMYTEEEAMDAIVPILHCRKVDDDSESLCGEKGLDVAIAYTFRVMNCPHCRRIAIDILKGRDAKNNPKQ